MSLKKYYEVLHQNRDTMVSARRLCMFGIQTIFLVSGMPNNKN